MWHVKDEPSSSESIRYRIEMFRELLEQGKKGETPKIVNYFEDVKQKEAQYRNFS